LELKDQRPYIKVEAALATGKNFSISVANCRSTCALARVVNALAIVKP
jgi:hypothetical protein